MSIQNKLLEVVKLAESEGVTLLTAIVSDDGKDGLNMDAMCYMHHRDDLPDDIAAIYLLLSNKAKVLRTPFGLLLTRPDDSPCDCPVCVERRKAMH